MSTLVTVSGASTADFVTTLSWSHTVGTGTNRALLVAVGQTCAGGQITSVTYGGVALTRLVTVASGAVSSDRRVELWRLLAPASGTATITVTNPAGETSDGRSIDFTGVDQITPFGAPVSASGTGTSATATAPGASDDIVLGAMSARSTTLPTQGASMTSRWNVLVGSNVVAAGATTDPDATSTTSWTWTTSDKYAVAAVAVKAIAASRYYRLGGAMVATRRRYRNAGVLDA